MICFIFISENMIWQFKHIGDNPETMCMKCQNLFSGKKNEKQKKKKKKKK